jgi:hypothetical protein
MSIVASPSHGSLTYLGHFQRRNLVESTRTVLNLAEVLAKNPCSGGVDAIVLDALVTELGLVAGESNTSSIAAVVLRSESDESPPATSNVEVTITGLKSELLADDGQLVVLELLKSFLALEILDDTSWCRSCEGRGT